jgi:hypothetical protein
LDGPKLIIFDDISASSVASLDVQFEFEVDSEDKIQNILKGVERELYCPNSIASTLSQMHEKNSRKDERRMHPWRSIYPQLNDIKKKKNFQEEFINHCEEWRTTFCHIG